MVTSIKSLLSWMYLLFGACFVLLNFKPSSYDKQLVEAKTELETLLKIEYGQNQYIDFVNKNISETEFNSVTANLKKYFLEKKIKLNTSLATKDWFWYYNFLSTTYKNGDQIYGWQTRKLIENWKQNNIGAIFKINPSETINPVDIYASLRRKNNNDDGLDSLKLTDTLEAIITSAEKFAPYPTQNTPTLTFIIDAKDFYNKYHMKSGFRLDFNSIEDTTKTMLFKKWVKENYTFFNGRSIDLTESTKIIDEIGHMTTIQAVEYLGSKVEKAERTIAFFGMNINRRSGLVFGPFIILLFLLFIYLNIIHINNLGGLEKTELVKHPIILFQHHWIAHLIFVLLLILFPLIALITLTFSYWNKEGYKIIMILYPICILLCAISLFYIWKARKLVMKKAI